MIYKRWHAATVLVALPVVLWLTWPDRRDVAKLEARGGPSGQPLQLLEVDAREHPDDAAVLRRLAMAYEIAGKLPQALASWEKLAAMRPLSTEDVLHVRRAAISSGEPAKGLALVRPQLAQLPWPESAAMVRLALMAGEPATAADIQAHVARQRPDDPAVFAALRDLLLAAGRGHEAMLAQQKLMTLQPSAAGLLRLADLQLQDGDPAKALDTRERDPGIHDLAWHRQCGQLAEWSKQPARAVPHWQRAYELSKQTEDAKRWLTVLAASRSTGLLAAASLVVGHHPADAEVLRAAGDLLMGRGQHAAALELAERLVRLQPTDAAVHERLVDVALGVERQDVAIAELQRWHGLRPQDWRTTALLAQVQMWHDDTAASQRTYGDLFAQLGTAAPADLLAHRVAWLGITPEWQDTEPGVLANMEAIVAQRPASIEIRRRLVEALQEVGDYDRALYHQRLLAASPKAVADDRLGVVTLLRWAGRTEEAFVVCERLARAGQLPAPVARDMVAELAHAEAWPSALRLQKTLVAHGAAREDWGTLSRLQERFGRLAEAATSWRRWMALGRTDESDRLFLAQLLVRAGQRRESLRALMAEGDGASIAEVREAVTLATELGRQDLAELSLRRLLRHLPDDIGGLTGLATLLERRGDRAGAAALDARAWQAAGDDPVLGLQVMAQRGGGRKTADADRLMERLSHQPSPSTEALRLLADYYRDSRPDVAIRSLDALHARTAGDIQTWFARGELAQRLGDESGARRAWARVVEPTDRPLGVDDRETRAVALQRLGRTEPMLAAWHALQNDYPTRLQPWLAEAWYHLQQGQLGLAERCLDTARRLAPNETDVRLLHAEWLQVAGRSTEALAVAAALRAEHPDLAEATFTEASLRHRLGQFRQARALGATALRQSSDPGVRQAYREWRGDGAPVTTVAVSHESTGLLDSFIVGADGTLLLDDHWRLNAQVGQIQYGGGAAPIYQATVGTDWRQGPFAADGKVALPVQAGQAPLPLAMVGGSWRQGPWKARLSASSWRWEEANQTAAQGGRENKLGGEVSWEPLPQVGLKLQGDVGQLSLPSVGNGLATTVLGEATFKWAAESPFYLAYQYRRRYWGTGWDSVNLPEQIQTHALALGWAAQLGDFQLDLAPGYAVDATSWQGAPMIFGNLTWEPAPDVAVTLNGGWGGRSFSVGSPETYHTLRLSGHWWF